MTITAKVILDSVNMNGNRLTTIEVYYPALFHQDVMTHRAFSRNFSSTRAIPIERMIQNVIEDPASPIHWGTNKPGMQAGAELEGDDLAEAQAIWEMHMTQTIEYVRKLSDLGLHKQVGNMLLWPHMHMRGVVTATNWENFFALRDHPDARPEIQALAQAIREALDGSTPILRQYGEWHLPYVTEEESRTLSTRVQTRCSVARCARVSYRLHDGTAATVERDLELYDRLVGSTPLHASPTEHQAYADHLDVTEYSFWDRPLAWKWRDQRWHGNLVGFCQYRKMLPGEFVTNVKVAA